MMSSPLASIAQSAWPSNTGGSSEYEMMVDFARCKAVYEAMAMIAENAGYPANAEQLRGAGRGAEAASRVTFMIMDLPYDNATSEQSDAWIEKVRARSARIEDLYALETNRQAAFSERGELDEEGMAYCIITE